MANEEYTMKGGKKGRVGFKVQQLRDEERAQGKRAPALKNDESWVKKLGRKVKAALKPGDNVRTKDIHTQTVGRGNMTEEDFRRFQGKR